MLAEAAAGIEKGLEVSGSRDSLAEPCWLVRFWKSAPAWTAIPAATPASARESRPFNFPAMVPLWMFPCHR